MAATYESWDPVDPSQWEKFLGLVCVPLFGAQRSVPSSDKLSILLDGRASSFLLSTVEDDNPNDGYEQLSWAWSSHVRHLLRLDSKRAEMTLSRWDSPGTYRRFRLPSGAQGACELFQLLEDSPPPRAVDVILHVLRAFRQLRSSLYGAGNLHAIQLFNALLVGTEAARRDGNYLRTWQSSRTFGDALRTLDPTWLTGLEVADLLDSIGASPTGNLLDLFLQPEPMTGSLLEPDLLLRHAAGQLYQEAHLIIEKEEQLSFAGLSPADRPGVMVSREVRFTPSSLARLLVQQAFNAFGSGLTSRKKITLLDPACGSGVFLQEALRELQSRGYHGEIAVRGFDISDVSCAMARFALARAKRDSEAKEVRVDVEITPADALTYDWGKPDVVLMNPPFASLETMPPTEREVVSGVLGSLDKGRTDKSMAFVWKAVSSLGPGGVAATMLPASLLETGSGTEWRAELSRQADLHLVGHFRGYGFFTGSIVQPGFLVLRRRVGVDSIAPPVKIVVANENNEDNAIRGLRQYDTFHKETTEEGWEVFEMQATAILPTSWLPRSSRYQWLIDKLTAAQTPTAGCLFDVQQGIKTGRNKAFLLSERELTKLPPSEQAFFRPIASNSTIRDGRIERDKFLFYPYDESGLTLMTRDQLLTCVPTYYSSRLSPEETALRGRAGIDQEKWWALIRDRLWQRVPAPKLVSKAFGEQGGFAYDDLGDTVVLQGCAWLWRGTPDADDGAFHETPLPWAYLALLNSGLLEILLGFFCTRVRGGQFDLSPRFVERIFLPDLSNDLFFPSSVIQDLAWLGRQIHQGQYPPVRLLDEAAARAYGVSMSEFDSAQTSQMR